MTALVFDRRAVRRHRDRAAANFHQHDFLFREIGDRLLDRLEDMARRFPLALDLGCRTGHLARHIGARGGIERLISADLSAGMAGLAQQPRIVADEEALPFAPARFDLVMSNLALHWTNDLPGALLQIRQILKPDGLLLAALFGGETLIELREALLGAEIDLAGGASPRLSPVLDLPDAGMLLQRAGFALPVVDTDILTVTYPDALALMRDLRGMGETNAAQERLRHPTRRAILAEAASRYAARHADSQGRIAARFQVIFLTGWAPSDSTPKAARRGSATHRLAEALGTVERKAGDKAGH
jgi:NADH dehydrogenase [ubiquinone] 1 alpha subcomplex assembly factor 5